jgi:hypothetical protein
VQMPTFRVFATNENMGFGSLGSGLADVRLDDFLALYSLWESHLAAST